jgi:hypothetical protein
MEKVEMPKRSRATQDDVDSDFDTVTSMAKRMGLEGDDHDRYVHKSMTSLGHKSVRSYVPNDSEGDSDDDDDDFFPRSRRSSRGKGNRRNSDDDW